MTLETVGASDALLDAHEHTGEHDLRAELIGIWKVFDGVPVLKGVDIALRRGEIHAILGGNGSGKSTLMKILSGVYNADAGEIRLDGKPVHVNNPSSAHKLGVYLVPQEPKIFPHLSVLENLLLGTRIPIAEAMTQIDGMMREVGFETSLHEAAGNLSIANQQLVEIMRGLLRDARVLILDEPTSALTSREVEALFAHLRILAKRGIGIFFISHRLNEILTISDRVSVLRDGAIVFRAATANLQARNLIDAMLPEGTEITHFGDEAAAQRDDAEGDFLLEVRGLSGEQFHDVSLRVRAGEVVGLAGLVGAGRTELARAIVGLDAVSAGEVIICGRAAPERSPHSVQEMGLSYVPEDRHSHGIFLGLPNLHTMSAGILHRLGQPLLSSGKEREVGARFTQALRIKSSGLAQHGRTLSGGNQQKTVLAKCLAGAPRVLILDEPTRGIDVQARLDVYNLIHELAEQGMGVLLISSDFEEIVHLSDRVLIMYHGRLTGELSRTQCKIDQITAGAFGIKEGLNA